MKDTKAGIMTWYLALQPYKIELLHCPGQAQAKTDFFSRIADGERRGDPPPGWT